jgi:hypothetical protein
MHLHENMLFRWVGYDVEMGYDKAKLTAPKRPLIAVKTELTDEQRKHYLDRLRDAFDPNKGLRASEYHYQDKVGKHAAAAEPKPCLFFTEQAAGDAEGHWRRYGRMGLGFSKRAIFNHGGSPVIYTGGKDSTLEKSIDVLRGHLVESGANRAVADAFEVFARFVKVTRLPPDDVKAEKTKPSENGSNKRAPRRKADPMAYPIEQRIRFLAEREWRLLENTSQKSRWRRCSDGWLWFRPELGRELQLVILPDNRTLRMAIDCDIIRKSLVVPNRPPVQLITADALKKI